METKLKPCPFCANTNLATEAEMRGNHKEYWVACCNCGAEGPADLGWSGAEEAWNMRRPADKLLEACKAAYGEDFITPKVAVILTKAIRAAEGEE